MKKIKLTEQQFKKLIENILLHQKEDRDFTSKLIHTDSITGSRTWDIEYKTNLDKTYKEIDESVERLEDLVSQDINEDNQELLEIAKLLRNKFSRYKRKYQ